MQCLAFLKEVGMATVAVHKKFLSFGAGGTLKNCRNQEVAHNDNEYVFYAFTLTIVAARMC